MHIYIYILIYIIVAVTYHVIYHVIHLGLKLQQQQQQHFLVEVKEAWSKERQRQEFKVFPAAQQLTLYSYLWPDATIFNI